MKKVLLTVTALFVVVTTLQFAPGNSAAGAPNLECKNYREPDFNDVKCKSGQQICCDEAATD